MNKEGFLSQTDLRGLIDRKCTNARLIARERAVSNDTWSFFLQQLVILNGAINNLSVSEIFFTFYVRPKQLLACLISVVQLVINTR